MPESPRPSLVARAATLTLSASVLAILVAKATLTSGCRASEPDVIYIGGEPRQTEPPPATGVEQPQAKSLQKPRRVKGSGRLEIGGGAMGASKSGAMFWPEEDEARAKPPRQAAPQQAGAR